MRLTCDWISTRPWCQVPRFHTRCNMKPWWLGICLWTLPHPHGSHFSFVIGEVPDPVWRITSCPRRLGSESSMTWWLVIAEGSTDIIKHRPGDTYHHYPNTSTHRHQLGTPSTMSPKVTPPSSPQFHSTAPTSFPSSQQNCECYEKSRMANNVHHDVRRNAKSLMSEFHDGTSRPKGQSLGLIFMYPNNCMCYHRRMVPASLSKKNQ
jgi:hypothetical protein